jgi:hypothetical protein
MSKAADFAFRQAVALCPYSPEAIFRYVNLLVSQSRIEDALAVAQLSWKVDPTNEQMKGLVDNLTTAKKASSGATK